MMCSVEGIEHMVEQQARTALSERESARYIGISAAVLRLWRSQEKGPRYFRAGEKLVRYRKSDLDLWIEQRLSAPAAVETR
jgi:predicted DNA-binding transcriptional regulator AlpA